MADACGPGVVMTRTPLRLSFAGGGTDLAEFYRHDHGAVFSTAIDKYVYVTVKRHSPLFKANYRLNYFSSESVDTLDEIRNEIMRECLRLVPVTPPIYISTIGDLPASSGLGSSSSFAIGLLHALHTLRQETVSPAQLAEEAVKVEIEMLKHPIGKQDQYAAAFGGLNFIRFLSNERVAIEPLTLSAADIRVLFSHLMMFWTGISRDSAGVLTEQKRNSAAKRDDLTAMRDQAEDLHDHARNGFSVQHLAEILDEGWRRKRGLASSISNPAIDDWYARAKQAGALGGKLAGAGGGGFLTFIVPPDRQDAVRAALSDLTEVPVGYEPHGSKVLLPVYG